MIQIRARDLIIATAGMVITITAIVLVIVFLALNPVPGEFTNEAYALYPSGYYPGREACIKSIMQRIHQMPHVLADNKMDIVGYRVYTDFVDAVLAEFCGD